MTVEIVPIDDTLRLPPEAAFTMMIEESTGKTSRAAMSAAKPKIVNIAAVGARVRQRAASAMPMMQTINSGKPKIN